MLAGSSEVRLTTVTMSMPERVRLSRGKGSRLPANMVVVARPTRWGNPFAVERFGTERAIALYRAALEGGWSPDTVADMDDRTALFVYEATMALQKRLGGIELLSFMLADLRGKNLACWCPMNQPCHADVLLELANA